MRDVEETRPVRLRYLGAFSQYKGNKRTKVSNMNKLLSVALAEYGVKEIVGEKHNPVILKYFEEIGFSWVKDDETSWCSAFVNACAKRAGFEYSGKLDARSWLNVGHDVKDPIPGDIVVFWREDKNSWKGHVGVYINRIGDFIYVLGGNQSNMVNIAPYNVEKLLGYRRLKKINK
jgi:uncharacterized protein (TIGR02594 family)